MVSDANGNRRQVFMSCRPCSLISSHVEAQENTARAALPCLVQSVLLPADALPVPVRVHEGPCQHVFMKVRAHQNLPIRPATNLVSRFGGSGNGLSHELPEAKAVAELVHKASCLFRVETERTLVRRPMKRAPDWGFFSTSHALMGTTITRLRFSAQIMHHAVMQRRH